MYNNPLLIVDISFAVKVPSWDDHERLVRYVDGKIYFQIASTNCWCNFCQAAFGQALDIIDSIDTWVATQQIGPLVLLVIEPEVGLILDEANIARFVGKTLGLDLRIVP